MFDYYYGNEAEQFTFLRVPKFLFIDKAFATLSSDAKILYSLMLDRMTLSVKSGWLDEKNRVYIIFTHEEAQQCMCCGRDKCTKIYKELEDIGLIVRKKRGMGKPALIFVKNFVSDIEEEETLETKPKEQSDELLCEDEEAVYKTTEKPLSRVRKNRSQDYGKAEVLTTEKPMSRVRENRSQDYGKTVPIKTDKIKTDCIETDDINQSYQSVPHPQEFEIPENSIDGIDRTGTAEAVKKNIDYDLLKENYSSCGELVDEIAEIITDVVTGMRKVYVSGKAVPERLAADKFLLLTYEHVEYVIDSISRLETHIAKPDVYICTALYNASYTLNISTFSGFTASTGIALRTDRRREYAEK